MNHSPFTVPALILGLGAVVALWNVYGGSDKPAHAASTFSARVFLDGQP